MSGFDNEVLYANNVDFSGAFPVSGKVIADGQLLIGSTASPNIRVSTLTPGAGINIQNSSGSIVISATGAGFVWNVVTSATNTNPVAKENGYIAKGAGSVVFLLPVVAAIGDEFIIVGYGNLWTLTQNAGQSVILGPQQTTVGITGSLTATMASDSCTIVCVTANTEFKVINEMGNLAIV